MIGNNAEEDVAAAAAVGMDTYLLTECLIDEKGLLEKGLDCPRGSFPDLLAFLKDL